MSVTVVDPGRSSSRRRTVMGALPGGPPLRAWVSTGLSVAGGVIIAVVGGLLLAGAWACLG